MSDNLTANDLRVGNFYYLNDIEVKLDERLLFAMFNNPLAYGLQNYTPIPLTKERLLKFGFIFSYSRGFEEYYDKNDVGLTIIGSGTPDIKILYRNTQLKFVHQLQSLYYTLTQKELL